MAKGKAARHKNKLNNKQAKLNAAKKELDNTLRKSGYLRYLEKHGKSIRPAFPDLSVNTNLPTSDKIVHVSGGKKDLPPDAKQFNVQSPHKQGYMLHIPSDGMEFAGGKKS